MAETSIHRPLRVLVLGGGPSPEREVSLASATAVSQALKSAGHTVTRFDPIEGHLFGVNPALFDVAFIALHGEYGEDGQVQSQLAKLGLPYTGSDQNSSQIAISKSLTKQRLDVGGVPTPAWAPIGELDRAEKLDLLARRFGFPLVIKPDTAGSSLGVTILNSRDELPQALSRCFHYGTNGVMETAIPGTEWTVGLIDEVILPPIQIVTSGEFYDFEAKYISDETEYRFETDASAEQCQQLQEMAREASDLLGTSGIVRVDFRVDKYGQPWVLEINTIPGMTSHSLVPKAAERVGISFAELCERALVSALEQSQRTRRIAA